MTEKNKTPDYQQQTGDEHSDQPTVSRRHFIKTSVGAMGATILVGCGDAGKSEQAEVDGFADADMSDDGFILEDTDAGDDGDVFSGDADEDMIEEVDYPRGEPPLFEESPVAPADPSSYDAAVSEPFAPEAVPLEQLVFQHGVAAGNVQTERVVLWGVVEPAAVTVMLKVWRESDSEGEVAMVRDIPVAPDANGYIKVGVDGLAPGTWYHYGLFTVDNEQTPVSRSVLGRVRTAFLPDGVAPLTIGASTCTSYRNAPWTSCGLLAQEDMDLFVHVGDFVYADGSMTREDYRFHYLRAHAEPNMQAALARAGVCVTWDDHEFDNNFDPETMPATLLETAKAAFFENHPQEPAENGQLWRRFRWGRTAEFFVLDSRTERLPSTIESDMPIYIGKEQMAWLKAGLVDSPCRFKILLNSVPMVNLQGAPAEILAEDRWQGYQVQRQEILDFLYEENIRDVYFISGDFHMGFVSRLDPDGIGSKVWDVAVGPGANGPNPMATTVENGLFYEEDVFPPEMYEYWSSATEVATTMTFDPVTGDVFIRYVEGNTGSVLYEGTVNQLD